MAILRQLPLVCAFCAFFVTCAPAADNLAIENGTANDILNIMGTPEKDQVFFVRLDLAPGASDMIENPASDAALRVDTGLEFWLFPSLNLGAAQKLAFHRDSVPYLLVEGEGGKTARIDGKVVSLLANSGQNPLCDVEDFHPAMPMEDVCAKLSPQMPRDDNGAVITPLGFVGLPWAGRLVPVHDGEISGFAALEHLELRRPLEAEVMDRVLTHFRERGYVPWRADFPKRHVDFSEIAGKELEEARTSLDGYLNNFIKKWKSQPPQAGNPEDMEAACSILFAPGQLLPELAKTGASVQDARLFTMRLLPQSNTLLLDVAAYQGTGDKAGPGN